jgi:histidinol-phosphatase (PHP family)
MRISYHNHTTWSDGKSSIPEMIEAARKAGLDELGISDHFALAPDRRRFSWSSPLESLEAYVEDVLEAIRNTKDLTIRLGVEVDYFPETLEESIKRLALYPFDFLIGSVHFIDEFIVDLNAKPWEGLSQDQRDEIWRVYWHHLRNAAESRCFDFIGHFDLPKKFGFFPSIDLTKEALAALDAIASADAAIEINCSGWDKPAQEAYPKQLYLQEARLRNIPLLINADAHSADDITRHFGRARELAASAGYTELVRFEKRQRFSYPLE